MAELPIMPLKTDALLADTSHLSTEEFGAYCRLLFVMWRSGGKLVDDASQLANITGISKTRWKRISKPIMRLMTVGDGFISQKRLTDTWLQIQSVRRKRALAAGERWCPTKCKANGMQMHMQMQSRSNANHISKEEERITEPHASEEPPREDSRVELGASEELNRVVR